MICSLRDSGDQFGIGSIGTVWSASPWNWQAGNYLRLSLTYEAA